MMNQVLLKKIITNTINSYQVLRFRDVINRAFYDMCHIMNKYILEGAHVVVIKQFYETLLVAMYPIIPHIITYICKMRNIVNISYPIIGSTPYTLEYLTLVNDYCNTLCKKFKKNINQKNR